MPLPMSVFQWKHGKVKEFLAENGYEALAVTTPANFYMLTGFHLDVAPWEQPVAAVFPREGEPFMVMNSLSTHHLMMAKERNCLYVTDWVTYYEHNRYFKKGYVTPQWTELLAARLHAAGIRKGTVAVDGSGGSLAGVKKKLPDLDFVDVTPFMVETREVKHPEELEVIRLAAALTDWGQDRYAVIEQGGFGDNIFHRTGHGIGIEGHDFPADVAFNYRPLKENEVWSCEPGVYIYGVGGFRQDNTVFVGRDRPEIVTKRSVRLEDQIVPV